MKKPDVNKALKQARRVMNVHSPEILTGLGIAGMVSTTILAVRATPKALDLIAQAEEEKKDNLTKTEVVKVAWKPYIPVVMTGSLSIACVIGAGSVNAKRNAALAAAYKLSETAFSEYKDQVVATLGEKKEKAIHDKVAKEKVDKNPVSKSQVIITDKGNTLCLDTASGRYFRSDMDKINRAVNKLNSRLISYDYVSLTDFYNELGLEPTSFSDRLGWKLGNGLVEVLFSSQLTDDGQPCLVLDYEIVPEYDFDSFA